MRALSQALRLSAIEGRMSAHSSRGASWDTLRRACLDRDGWVCTHCGKDLIGEDATADHVVPRALGGPDALWNLQASCRRCNGIKSDHVLVRVPWFSRDWLDRI
jgi:5-methylcytosine-specific restriction endonuclease McrA